MEKFHFGSLVRVRDPLNFQLTQRDSLTLTPHNFEDNKWIESCHNWNTYFWEHNHDKIMREFRGIWWARITKKCFHSRCGCSGSINITYSSSFYPNYNLNIHNIFLCNKHWLERWSVYAGNPLPLFVLQVLVTVCGSVANMVRGIVQEFCGVWKPDHIISAVLGNLKLRCRIWSIVWS